MISTRHFQGTIVNKLAVFIEFMLTFLIKMCSVNSFFKNCKISTTLNLFSDYLNNPQNIQIKWDFRTDLKINKFLSSSIKTNLIYDDKILIADKNGNLAPRVQFQEIFSLSFTYTFGEFVK